MFDRLIEFLLGLIEDILPVFVVPVYNRCVVLRGGKYHRTVGPGIYGKISFLDQPQQHTVVTTTLPIPVQSVITKDGKQLAVKAIAKFNISDIQKYVEEIYDATDAIQDLTQAKIMLIINALAYEDCRDTECISNEVSKKVRAEVKKYGIEIEQITLTDLVEAPSYRLFLDNSLCE